MMRYKGYVGRVQFDHEAKVLHGEVLGIRDVVTFQARSVDQVEQAFRESVDDCLAFCKQRGEQPDKPASGRFVARLPVPLHQKLTLLAQFRGKSLNALVEELLQKEVETELREERQVSNIAGKRRARRAG